MKHSPPLPWFTKKYENFNRRYSAIGKDIHSEVQKFNVKI